MRLQAVDLRILGSGNEVWVQAQRPDLGLHRIVRKDSDPLPRLAQTLEELFDGRESASKQVFQGPFLDPFADHFSDLLGVDTERGCWSLILELSDTLGIFIRQPLSRATKLGNHLEHGQVGGVP